MALPTTEIFLRSPYWLTVTETDLDYVICDLRIWTGALSAEPANPDVKLRSTAGLEDTTSMDIGEFARDFVEVIFSGTNESNAVFISYQLTKYIKGSVSEPTPEAKVYLTGLDGYGTFQDGVNFQWYRQIMMSDSVVTMYDDTPMYIPVLQNNLTGYQLQRYAAGYGGALSTFHTVTGLTPVENTANMIEYVASVIGGVYADRVVFNFNNTGNQYVDINYEQCNKHGNTSLYFVNRLGCVQEISFFGRFDVSMEAESEKYKRNLLVNGNYNKTRHQDYTLNKNGKITMSLNSGWRSEEENDTFIEMMMSEQVWIKVDTSRLGKGWVPKELDYWTIPVNVSSNSSQIKNALNDKLINYSFKFDAAHDWINTVR